MLDSVTLNQLYDMRLSGMVEALRQQEQNFSAYKDVAFEDRFSMLVTAEYNRRESNTLNKLIKSANFKYPNASVEDINYVAGRNLEKERVQKFARCNYIVEKHHIVITGSTGTGKSYLVCALGISACRSKYKVKYFRLQELLNNILLARAEGTYRKYMDRLKKYNLLIIDDFLLNPISDEQVSEILEIIEASINNQSIIICSQYEIRGWYDRLGSNDIAPLKEAIMDRIFHYSYEIFLKGDVSMRSFYGVKDREGC